MTVKIGASDARDARVVEWCRVGRGRDTLWWSWVANWWWQAFARCRNLRARSHDDQQGCRDAASVPPELIVGAAKRTTSVAAPEEPRTW